MWPADQPTRVNFEKALHHCKTKLSWRLATAADRAKRDSSLAVQYARDNVNANSESANNWSNLGVALTSDGQFQDAVPAFEKSDELRGKADIEHRLFLAQALWGLGETERALNCYIEGALWAAKQRPKSSQYRRFVAETEERLEITDEQRKSLLETPGEADLPPQ